MPDFIEASERKVSRLFLTLSTLCLLLVFQLSLSYLELPVIGLADTMPLASFCLVHIKSQLANDFSLIPAVRQSILKTA